jgi:hypothetical protein
MNVVAEAVILPVKLTDRRSAKEVSGCESVNMGLATILFETVPSDTLKNVDRGSSVR